MPGLELIGPIAGRAASPAPDERVRNAEGVGLFVAGDVPSMLQYSGSELGWRWLCRAQGPLTEAVPGWPEGPNGPTFGYFHTEEEARAYYGALRHFALSKGQGLVPQDTRQNFPLNTPNAYAESFWQGTQEVLRLIYDRLTDQQVFVRHTDVMNVLPSTDTGGPIIAFHSENTHHYLAIARGAGGGAEHVVIVFSERHQPTPVIPEGMPRAEWMTKFDRAGIRFEGDALIVGWGALSGPQLLAHWSHVQPYLPQHVVVPLHAPPDVAPRLDQPPGYAIRMEPGTYSVTYLELLDTPTGTYTCVAISRDGAPTFMPAVVGNAGGIVHGGLTVDRYAMLSVERDNLVMQQGPQAVFGQPMAALCQKYGIPFTAGGLAGRVQGWELMIQGDAAFSAQWVVHRQIATMRLQGIEPTPEQIAQMGQHQAMVTDHLERAAQQHKDLNATIEQGALHAIRFSSNQSPEAILAEVQRVAPQARASDVLYRALKILRDPGEDGNPRFDAVDTRVDPLARAHWLSMPEDDRRFEGGKVDKYVKEQIADIYPNNDLKVPGFLGFLSRL